MALSSAPRWWSRLLRKQLLVATAIGILVLACCAPAFADAPTVPFHGVPPDTTALASAVKSLPFFCRRPMRSRQRLSQNA